MVSVHCCGKANGIQGKKRHATLARACYECKAIIICVGSDYEYDYNKETEDDGT